MCFLHRDSNTSKLPFSQLPMLSKSWSVAYTSYLVTSYYEVYCQPVGKTALLSEYYKMQAANIIATNTVCFLVRKEDSTGNYFSLAILLDY